MKEKKRKVIMREGLMVGIARGRLQAMREIESMIEDSHDEGVYAILDKVRDEVSKARNEVSKADDSFWGLDE